MMFFQRFHRLLVILLLLATAEGAPEKLRVLILGDEVYRPSAATVAKALKDSADVVFATASPEQAFTTQTAVAKIDEWLGDKPWDLIYFNFGLTDLVHRAPGLESFRVMGRSSGGVRATRPEDYEKNLRELVRRLKTTRAKLVWTSTVPIGRSMLDIHEPGSEIEYNRIAAQVMTEAKVPIFDMHAYCLSLLTPKEIESGSRPEDFTRKPLYSPMIATICQELKLPRPPEPPQQPRRR